MIDFILMAIRQFSGDPGIPMWVTRELIDFTACVNRVRRDPKDLVQVSMSRRIPAWLRGGVAGTPPCARVVRRRLTRAVLVSASPYG